jgi:hypothetical protein
MHWNQLTLLNCVTRVLGFDLSVGLDQVRPTDESRPGSGARSVVYQVIPRDSGHQARNPPSHFHGRFSEIVSTTLQECFVWSGAHERVHGSKPRATRFLEVLKIPSIKFYVFRHLFHPIIIKDLESTNHGFSDISVLNNISFPRQSAMLIQSISNADFARMSGFHDVTQCMATLLECSSASPSLLISMQRYH